MTYEEIIQRNETVSPVNWWPHYAFHYTDLSNAVSIIKSGFLMSRSKACDEGMMINDNASGLIIDATKDNVKEYVRFYFRPLTPTQYHNEGFKHRSIRYEKDIYANVPVPVFFLFDIISLLKLDQTCISGISLAASGSEMIPCTVDVFDQLDFEKIYHNAPTYDREIKKYRQAEIVFPEMMKIEGLLSCIVCRNEVEKATLLNELYLTDRVLFEKYNKRVYLIKDMIYYNNGLFVDECLYDSGRLSIVYSDTMEKKKYVENSGIVNLSPIEAEVEFEWKKGDEILDRKKTAIYVDYSSPKTEFINVYTNTGADLLRIRVWFEKHLMCNYCFRI